jgi:two-component sensor histidine kinase
MNDTDTTQNPSDPSSGVEQLLGTTDLANALESDHFKQFLDYIPIGIAVAELKVEEHIVYANLEFERLTGSGASNLFGKDWSIFPASTVAIDGDQHLSDAVTSGEDYIGAFTLARSDEPVVVDAWSNVIQDDDGEPVFRLLALAELGPRAETDQTDLRAVIQEKDTLLRELQHRVTNNLQMITALIRMESRTVLDGSTIERFDRLAGRIEALSLLYRSLSESADQATIDLGIYLSGIASAVMRAHAVEGIHLDLQVDTWPVSVNVAMPAGLVVNELMINALKHAFPEDKGGTISLHSLVDDAGCRVVVADDGVGLPDETQWPKPGKLSAMIVQALRQNANAKLEVKTAPGDGMRVTIFFARADAEK